MKRKTNGWLKALSVLMLIAMLCAFTACGTGEDTPPEDTTPENTTPVETSPTDVDVPPAEPTEAYRFDYLSDTGTMASELVLMSDNTVTGAYTYSGYALGTWTGTWEQSGSDYSIKLDANDQNDAATLTSEAGIVVWSFTAKMGEDISERTLILKSADATAEAAEIDRFAYVSDTGTMTCDLVLMSDHSVTGAYAYSGYNLCEWDGAWLRDGDNYIIKLFPNDYNEATTLTPDAGAIDFVFTAKMGEEIDQIEITLNHKVPEACAFEGEYYILNINQDGEEIIFESFIIDAQGVVTGACDASGLTSFEGKIDADGNFTAEMTRLGGTMSGTIDGNGHVEGSSECRGRTSTFSGDPL